MSFGAVDTLSGANADTTSTLSISCSGIGGLTVLICPNLNEGSGGATAADRRMLSGADILKYQLYQNAARTTVWGSYSWPYPAHAPAFAVPLAFNGTGSGQTSIYGRVLGGQATSPPATYLSTFSGAYVEFRYRYNDGLGCNVGLGLIARPSVTVNATVQRNCRVSAQDINFGSTGVLDSNVDANGQVAVVCTPGTSYDIALSNGNTGTGPTQRLMWLGAQGVTYGLYRNAARTLPWGSGIDSATGTGAGATQNLIVYGRVPPQSTPVPGTYADTVVVTVTY